MPQSEKDLVDRLAVVGTHPYDKEVNGIESRLDTLAVRIDDSKEAVTRLSRGFYEAARDPLSQAILATSQLGDIVVQIPKASGPKRTTLIAKARVSSRTVSTTFQKLLELGKTVIQSGELSKQKNEELEDRAAQASQRLAELIQVADAWVKSAVELKALRQDTAGKHHREVEAARSALRKPNGEQVTTSPDPNQQAALKSSEENERKALSAVQDAQRKLTESNNQLAKFSKLKLQQETATKSLQALRTRLDGELSRVQNTIKEVSDVHSFLAKISAMSFKAEGINEVMDTTELIRRLQSEIKPSSKLTGPFIDDPHALLEGLRTISAAE